MKEEQTMPVTKVSLSSSKIVGDRSAVPVDVIVNLIKYREKVYIGTLSGLIFDIGLSEQTLTSIHVIDNFVSKYEKSMHRCGLPPSRGDTNYRRNFLINGGYDTPANLVEIFF